MSVAHLYENCGLGRHSESGCRNGKAMLIRGWNKRTHTYFGAGLWASLLSSFLPCYGDAEMTVISPCPQGAYTLVSVLTWDCSDPQPWGGRGLPGPQQWEPDAGGLVPWGGTRATESFRSEWVWSPALFTSQRWDLKRLWLVILNTRKSAWNVTVPVLASVSLSIDASNHPLFSSHYFFILVFGVHRITACTSLSPSPSQNFVVESIPHLSDDRIVLGIILAEHSVTAVIISFMVAY